MSWKTQKEEEKLGCCGWGVMGARSWSCSAFAPRPSAACASLPQRSIPPCWDGAALSLGRSVGRAAGDRQLVGGGGKQDDAGELEIASRSRPGYSHKTARFPELGRLPSSSGTAGGERGEVYVPWGAQKRKEGAAAWKELQKYAQWCQAQNPTCSNGWGDSWIETMWVILFRLSCSRSLASKG